MTDWQASSQCKSLSIIQWHFNPENDKSHSYFRHDIPQFAQTNARMVPQVEQTNFCHILPYSFSSN